MQIAIFQTEDKEDLRLLSELARKIGIKVQLLSDEQKEDMGMSLLMREADRSAKVSRQEIMNKLGHAG